MNGERSNITTEKQIKRKRDKKERYMFTKYIIVHIFDVMKVVFIQLCNETHKFEHSWQNRFVEIVHILYEKQIAKKV